MQSLKAPSLSSLISERESTSLRGSNDSLIDSLELDDDVNMILYILIRITDKQANVLNLDYRLMTHSIQSHRKTSCPPWKP